ncbi:hypothetical protein MNBD_GAMMA06-921 [hydrothermal vent metagenome]|uniref:SoxXA-binding protein n=1 Tax=hydrothermal vent metagenome TaxID=652676 RepID=A0A3B0X6B9_9ZZZZ
MDALKKTILKTDRGSNMKIKNLSSISILSALLFSPVLAQASSYDDAVKDANASIDSAKAANYEWRDSRKMLKKADKLNKEGKTDKAMKLVTKAKSQGKLAVAQAEQQASVNGPY